MFPFVFQSRRDRAGEPEGGGTALAIDPGAPFEHGGEPAQETVKKPAEKSDSDKRVETLEADLARERKRNDELSESEKYWAAQARKQPRAESDDEPGDRGDAGDEEDVDIEGDKLLDLVSTKGGKGLREAGFVSRKELRAAVNEAVAAATQLVEGKAQDVQLDMQLAREFPEIAEDAARVSEGKAPTSELWKRSAQKYQEMVKLDQNLKKSGSTMILAARMAKSELAAEGKQTQRQAEDKTDKQRERRDRIAAQAGDRPGASGEEGNDTPAISDEQKQVMKHLGVKEEQFQRNVQKAGGRRRG